MQLFLDLRGVGRGYRFGDFEFNQLRRHAGLAQGLGDVLDEILCLELHYRDV